MITRDFLSKKYGTFLCMFDDCDSFLLDSYSWYLTFKKDGSPKYLVRNGANGTVYFHREKLNASSDVEVDHINRDTLDNRLENLRFCTRSENVRNRKAYSKKTKFKGIEQNKSKTLWRVAFTFEGVLFTSPAVFSEEEAARKYDQIVKNLYKEFANFNFPQENK